MPTGNNNCKKSQCVSWPLSIKKAAKITSAQLKDRTLQGIIYSPKKEFTGTGTIWYEVIVVSWKSRIKDQGSGISWKYNKISLLDSENWAYVTLCSSKNKSAAPIFAYRLAIEHIWLICSSRNKSAMISMTNSPCSKHANHIFLQITRISSDWYPRQHSPTFKLPPRTLDCMLIGKLSILDSSVVFRDFQCINNTNVCNFIL